MIILRTKQDKFRFELREEEWEFSTRKEMQEVLDYILDLKEKFGKIKNEH